MDYHGFPVQTLQSPTLQLDVLQTAGPRIVRLLVNGSNILAEAHDISWDTPYGTYRSYGGHRFWLAPEHDPTTYIPDNAAPKIEIIENGLRLTQPLEEPTHLRKSMEIRLDPTEQKVEVSHFLTNEGEKTVQRAAWGITQMKLGGLAIIPLSDPRSPKPSQKPDRSLVLWPYASLKDERLVLKDRLALVHARACLPAFKAGFHDESGWLAYWLGTCLFIKRFNCQPDAHYPDHDSNAEIYVNDRIIEIESLGPLTHLAPGQTLRHNETWEVIPNVPAVSTQKETLEQIVSYCQKG